MAQTLDYLKETPSQTAGPYVHIGLAPKAAGFEMFHNELGSVIAGPDTAGERITVEGRVIDGFGAPMKDALLETWQADGSGRFADGTGDFRGWGRIIPDFETGIFAFETVKPGRLAGQAPHISVWIVARGVNIGLQTRMYFPEDDLSSDPLLNRIEVVERRKTLVAEAAGPGRYRWDIVVQGERETVFLDV